MWLHSTKYTQKSKPELYLVMISVDIDEVKRENVILGSN